MNILSAKNEQLDDKKIAVLLSGGVDSSVVVYEMARQGLHPDCFYIKMGQRNKRSGTAPLRKTLRWQQPWHDAMVAILRLSTAIRNIGTR